MTLSPAMRKLVSDQQAERPTGIIPIEPLDIDRRTLLCYEVADILSDAVTGPAIHAHELAEIIVDTVLDAE